MRFLVGDVPPISITFRSPSLFRKSHKSALLDLWRFQSSGDERRLGVFCPSPISNTRVKVRVSVKGYGIGLVNLGDEVTGNEWTVNLFI